jgi:SHS2 domain-containing protein
MFETFDHTADLGLRVAADSLDELFAEAAAGLTSLIVADVGSVQPTQQRTLEISAPDLEYLYFDWLSELLYLFESEGWLSADAQVEISENSLRGTVHGEMFCEKRHQRSHEVKAITYHGLSVAAQEIDGKSIWSAEAIVDI